MFITCTGLLNSPPLVRRSDLTVSFYSGLCRNRYLPSQTASKHRSSHVMTISATVFVSCHRSGASLILRFLSSICSRPFAVYLRSHPGQPTTSAYACGAERTISHLATAAARTCRYTACRMGKCWACLLQGPATALPNRFRPNTHETQLC